MINGLGVLGWGVGGIEAEAGNVRPAGLMLIPDVVGFKLTENYAKALPPQTWFSLLPKCCANMAWVKPSNFMVMG